MSITMPVTPAANSRFSDQPKGYAGTQTAPNVFTVYNDDDLYSASIPAVLGTNLLEGPITLDARFVGIHAKAADAGNYPGGWNRSHDQAPRWIQQHTGPGVFVDAGMDAWIDACYAADQEVVVCPFGTPTWNSSVPGDFDAGYNSFGSRAPPVSLAERANYITWLVQRQLNRGRRIHYLNSWNEPQSAGASYWIGTPAQMAALVRADRLAAKAVDPQIKIVGPDCTGCMNLLAGYGIDWTDQFLKASDGAGGTGKDHIDILTLHSYDDGGFNDMTKLLTLKTNLANLLANNGITGKPVWSTEFGLLNPDGAKYTGPESARANVLLRFLLWNVVAGMSRAALYPLGWTPTPERARLWNANARLLNGATIQRINRVAGTDALACVINGQRYLV